MKTTLLTIAFLCLFLFSAPNLHAQDEKKDVIAKALNDYFFLERENIHVQLNKSIYTTNEQIWFKGYIFHRKKNLPFFTTVNIYVSLIDETGKILENKLLYGNIGSFSGSFKLNSKFASGKYYLQFYTNWMNNFAEDESAVYDVSVVNTTTGAGNALAKADPSKISIDIYPEGGNLINGAANNLGINVSDCNHEPIAVSTADIVDGSGKIFKTIQINKAGFGRFDLPAGTGQGFKAVVTIEGVKHEQLLPTAQLKGMTLEVNNYVAADKTLVTIRTNKLTQDAYAGRPVYLLIHQDEQALLYDLDFKTATEIKMALPSADLFTGINTVRIVDADMNQLAERIIYKNGNQTLTSEISKTSQNVENIDFQGKIAHPNMNISISALPENTRSAYETTDIYSSFLLLPYIEGHKKIAGKYYLNNFSKARMYELDMLLMCQKSKYAWQKIKSSPAENKFPFEMGLTLKGSLPKSAGDPKNARVRLYSLSASLEETTDVDTNGDFIYNNILIPDSSYVNFSLFRKGEKPKELTLLPQVLNANRKFYQPYIPPVRCYAPAGAIASVKTPNIFQENIELEEVKIDGKRLKYANVSGNGNLRGYKITQTEINSFNTLLNFIKYNSSFVVNDNGVTVSILSTRNATSLNAAPPKPIIYIDNMQVYDYDYLRMVSMNEVEEIYMNPHAIVPSVRNFMGIIRIYLNHNYKPKAKAGLPEIIVKSGFERITPFENVIYNTTDDEGFTNFGVIDWEANIMTDENGAFNLSVPNNRQKSMSVLIEGFSADGKLISESKVITIP